MAPNASTSSRADQGLSCRDVSARYGALIACRSLSIDVRPGELLGIVGPNGAGKTSFVGALNGMVAERGEIRLDGHLLSGRQAHVRKRLGLATVPDDRGLFPSLSIAENLKLGAFDLPRAERVTAIDEAVSFFPFLKNRMETAAGSLSGGEQQMLAIAKCLAGRPRALLLDEPSQGLAPIIIDELVRVFTGLRENGLPILLVEQNHGLVGRCATKIAIIVGGRLVFEGAPEALDDRDRMAQLFLPQRVAA